MSVTTENSDQLDLVDTNDPSEFVDYIDFHGKLRVLFFEFTQGASAGDAGSLAYLARLPAGRVRLILPLSRIYASAMGTGRTMDIGHLAYTDLDGSTVAADENDLDDGVDVASAGAFTPAGTIGTHETKEFDSQNGVTLTAQVNDGTLPAAATISGYFIYVQA